MSLSFFAPWFFAGIGLLAIPYLLHKIRRPEREPLPFSGTMFIPNVPKEVIERRRIQHLLLMLLRMLLLLLLALAFARPYLRALAAVDGPEAPAQRLILVDNSFSMGAGGAMEAAKKAARSLAGRANPGDAVGLGVFSDRFGMLRRLDAGATDQPAGPLIDHIEVSEEGTDYLNALMAAQRALSAVDEEDRPSGPKFLYVVSDFQRSGMPQAFSGWKLSADIDLVPVPVIHESGDANLGITDVAVRRSIAGELRVLAKVRNWSETDQTNIRVELTLNGQQVASKPVSIRAGHSTQVTFRLEQAPADRVEGIVSLSARDALALDNRRYFVWDLPVRHRVLVAGNSDTSDRWPAQLFFMQALPGESALPWLAEPVPAAGLERLGTGEGPAPDAIILPGAADLDSGIAAGLRDYLHQGGKVLLTWSPNLDPELLNESLLADSGVRFEDTRYPERRSFRYAILGWVDLEHPVFVPFKGTRYNDFSSIRFQNYARFDVTGDARVIAQYDDEAPAMIEVPMGEGSLILWTFPVDLDWTNLPKSPRFVPLVHETLEYLCGPVNQAYELPLHGTPPRNLEPGLQIKFPTENTPAQWTGDLDVLAERIDRAGFLRIRPPGTDEWRDVYAVNVDGDESDLTPITPAEFELKLAAAPILDEEASPSGIVGANRDAAGFVIEKEYGRYLLGLVFAFLLVEVWYMGILRG